MASNHLVTGATGFVGGALVLELLTCTNAKIHCVMRDSDPNAGRQRLEAGLRDAALAYGKTLPPNASERISIVTYDLTDPPPDMDLPAVDVVWHSAASLKYEERHRDEIYAHNYQGTRNVFALAKAAGAKQFNHISTAYVAGRKTGLVPEQPMVANVVTNNSYEASKIEAEKFLLVEQNDMETRVFRCSIVVGHSETYAATGFNGLYGFIRDLVSFERRVGRKLGRFLAYRSVYLRALADGPLNFVPIDLAASAIVRIGLADTDKRIFHIVNDTPPQIGPGVSMLFKELGMRPPRFVVDEATFTSIDQALNDALGFYTSYLQYPKHFDQSNVVKVLGAPIRSNMDLDVLYQYVWWYLDYLLSVAGVRLPEGTARRAERVRA